EQIGYSSPVLGPVGSPARMAVHSSGLPLRVRLPPPARLTLALLAVARIPIDVQAEDKLVLLLVIDPDVALTAPDNDGLTGTGRAAVLTQVHLDREHLALDLVLDVRPHALFRHVFSYYAGT